jgi:hypothetical protein
MEPMSVLSRWLKTRFIEIPYRTRRGLDPHSHGLKKLVVNGNRQLSWGLGSRYFD